MTDLLDEIEGPRRARMFITVFFGAVLMALMIVKVQNELLMTKAYQRQAVALERIADAQERANPPYSEEDRVSDGPHKWALKGPR